MEESERDQLLQCLICLETLKDRTILPECRHAQFCFACILKWTCLHRRCPLCNHAIGKYLLHDIRSDTDYTRYFLRPVSSMAQDPMLMAASEASIQRSLADSRTASLRRQLASRYTASAPDMPQPACYPPVRPREGEASIPLNEESSESNAHEVERRKQRAMERRRMIYREGLYAKHVGSNTYTKYKPPPSAAQFASSPDLQRRVLAFVQRELNAFPATNLDVEFLTSYILSIWKSLDIRSDEALRLLADFLGPEGAEHFSHEVYTYIRSPAKHPMAYDRIVRYDWPWLTYSPNSRTDDPSKSSLGSLQTLNDGEDCFLDNGANRGAIWDSASAQTYFQDTSVLPVMPPPTHDSNSPNLLVHRRMYHDKGTEPQQSSSSTSSVQNVWKGKNTTNTVSYSISDTTVAGPAANSCTRLAYNEDTRSSSYPLDDGTISEERGQSYLPSPPPSSQEVIQKRHKFLCDLENRRL